MKASPQFKEAVREELKRQIHGKRITEAASPQDLLRKLMSLEQQIEALQDDFLDASVMAEVIKAPKIAGELAASGRKLRTFAHDVGNAKRLVDYHLRQGAS